MKRVSLFAAFITVAVAGSATAASIAFLHTPEASADANQPLTISGQIFGAAELERATLQYRTGDAGPFKPLEMDRDNADTWGATIPAADVTGAVVSYFVEALDWTGRTLRIYASPESPQRVALRGGVPRRATVVEPTLKVEQLQANPVETPAPADDLAQPVKPPGRTQPKIETWEPDARPAVPPKPPKKGGPAAPAPKPSRLATDLMMFAAEDTTSLASRHEQSLTDAPAIVSVFTADQMRSLGVRTLADLMKWVPGFETSRDLPGFWRVAARGLRSDPEVLVLLDGHRQNNPYDGRVIWELPVENLDRVEIIRGPGSALYGSGAFAAVVNLVPRREDGVAGAVTAGSFFTTEARLRAGRKFGPLEVDGDADVTRRDGYVKPIGRDAISTDPDKPAGETDDHRLAFASALRVKYRLGEGKPVIFGSMRLSYEDRPALVGVVDVVGPGSDLAWQHFTLDTGATHTWNDWDLKARAYLDNHATNRLFFLFPQGYKLGAKEFPDGVQQRTTVSLWSGGVEASGRRELMPNNILTAGIQLERQAITFFDYRANVNGQDPTADGRLFTPTGAEFPQQDDEFRTRLVLGLFVQDEWQLTDTLQMTTGLRGDYVAGFGFTPSPRLAFVWRAAEQLSLKALFARAFRAPTFEEYLSNFALASIFNTGQAVGFDRKDPLAAVTMTSLELGGEGWVKVGESRVTVRGNGFWNEFSNPIEAVDSTGVPRLLNRGRGVRVFGAEAEGRYEWPKRAGAAFFTLSWTRATDLETAKEAPSFSLLTNVPQLRANTGIAVPMPRSTLLVTAQFGAERRNNARTTLEATRRYRIPAYGLLGFTLRSDPFWERWEVELAMQNLTDLDYRDDVPRPDERRMPGLLPREGLSGFLTIRAAL